MMRVSPESSREQIRVSKKAIKKGISFYKVGCDFIRQYKKNPNITNVRVIFITKNVDFKTLHDTAKKIDDVTKTMNTSRACPRISTARAAASSPCATRSRASRSCTSARPARRRRRRNFRRTYTHGPASNLRGRVFIFHPKEVHHAEFSHDAQL